MPTNSNTPLVKDRRIAMLEVAMKRQHFRQDALIEVLHVAQQIYGFLGPDVLRFVARRLKLPPSRVMGVATFYKLFTLKPRGKHTCVVCTGTACFVKQAQQILDSLADTTHVHPGETSSDGEISLVTARCLGACGTAPVVVYDEELQGNQSPASVLARWKDWLKNESAATA